MLKKLQAAKFLLLNEFSRKRPIYTHSTPTIPMELIYQIIDDYWPLLSQANGRFGLRSLAQTCRSLSDYCRPLLFHTITLHGRNFPFPYHKGMTTRPERFSKLFLAYPKSAGFLKELHIVFIKPHPIARACQSESTRAERKAQRAEMKSWQIVFSIPYATLSALHVNISWDTIPPELVTIFLQALKITPSLRSLEVDGYKMPLLRILQSCPSTLKHFGLLGNYFVPGRPDGWVAPPQPICALESLTLSVHLNVQWMSSVFLSESPLFNLLGLNHLRTSLYEFSINRFSKIHSLSSQNLRCIHIHMSRNPGVNVLNISQLKALTHIELVAERLGERYWAEALRTTRNAQLVALLDWLEASLESLGEITPQAVARLPSLTICILLQTDSPNAFDRYLEAWDTVTTDPDRALGQPKANFHLNTYSSFNTLPSNKGKRP
ncbi:hypothetical protein BKA70DRAFT_1569800 [Coprinopsis sp. MPI-PUGE-AT-0042]|nr:hypothetical protein BKA70DRAFT_1569800 [Coprinopsis sp. MPI-PUGE-AT-0042]